MNAEVGCMDYDTVNTTSNNLLILWYERDGRILVRFALFLRLLCSLSCFLMLDRLSLFSLTKGKLLPHGLWAMCCVDPVLQHGTCLGMKLFGNGTFSIDAHSRHTAFGVPSDLKMNISW